MFGRARGPSCAAARDSAAEEQAARETASRASHGLESVFIAHDPSARRRTGKPRARRGSWTPWMSLALVLATATCSASRSGGERVGRSGTQRPNLLLLMADQFRGDALGCAPNPAVRTPHLDRLAREGCLFPRAYSSTPSCTPARAALLTGMSPWGHGMLGYSRIAERYPVELPRVLARAGYRTHAIGKNHFHPQRHRHGYETVELDESGRVESEDFESDYRQLVPRASAGARPRRLRARLERLPRRQLSRWTRPCTPPPGPPTAPCTSSSTTTTSAPSCSRSASPAPTAPTIRHHASQPSTSAADVPAQAFQGAWSDAALRRRAAPRGLHRGAQQRSEARWRWPRAGAYYASISVRRRSRSAACSTRSNEADRPTAPWSSSSPTTATCSATTTCGERPTPTRARRASR